MKLRTETPFPLRFKKWTKHEIAFFEEILCIYFDDVKIRTPGLASSKEAGVRLSDIQKAKFSLNATNVITVVPASYL